MPRRSSQGPRRRHKGAARAPLCSATLSCRHLSSGGLCSSRILLGTDCIVRPAQRVGATCFSLPVCAPMATTTLATAGSRRPISIYIYVVNDSFCYNSNKALRFRDNAAFVRIRAKEQQTYLFIAPTSLPLGATDMGLFTVGGLAVGQKKGVGQVGPARTGMQS